ncbi:YhfC family intramembrane metalloprotease [uncultured Ruminococcus sp.]|uniref:YhfC family intramembrane metalloprotease n=1 Tax=uncultured Ruminococcus sp. TaxID=165186 RepID=UPI0025FA6C8F|nr:YhfC family glutamic-type intramembrane protease [uncultured Ruminococcus sp.]
MNNVMMIPAYAGNISFPQDSIVYTVISGVLMALVAVIGFFIMKSRMKINVKAMVTGAVIWFVFAIVLKSLLLSPLLILDNSVSRAIKENVWLYYFIGAVAAGLFEETGRLVAFGKVLKKSDDKQDSLSYGLGHGGFEALYLGYQIASVGIMMAMINKGGIDSVAKGASPEMTQQLLDSIKQYSSNDMIHALLFGFERIPAVFVHISGSVLVYAAVKERKTGLYLLAMFLHFAIDYTLVLYYAEILPLWVTEILFAVITTPLFAAVMKLVYNKMDSKKEGVNGLSGNI